MLQFEEVAVMDRNSEYRGVPPEELMENAGEGLAKFISDEYSERSVLFICGTGNNGGDAYVAGRHLLNRWEQAEIMVYLVKGENDIRTDISEKNFQRFEGKVLDELDFDGIEKDTIIVDAMLGTGIKGDIREPYRSIIKKINEVKNPVVSVDVPSGLGADVSVSPDLTVTFHDKKEGMNRENSGDIKVVDIGVPEEALKKTGPGEMLLYPTSREDSHKGQNGRLLIVGGGPYVGAPALAGMAAYRTGVDLVHLAVPSSIVGVVSGYSPDFLVHPLDGHTLKKEHVEKISSIAKSCDSAVIGPGLGDDAETIEAVKELMNKIKIPITVDADALKAIDVDESLDDRAVLTPHGGEFEMMLGESIGEKLAERADSFAERTDSVLVVKGVEDYVTDGKTRKWNDFGNSGMTVGGTGDVLSGVIGALMSKGMDPFDAARTGVYMTCRAGDKAFEESKWGLIPEDIIEKLPAMFEDL